MAYDKEYELSETILRLHRALVGTSELGDFPDQISESIREAIPFDKLCLFLTGGHDSSPACITTHKMPMLWDKIYPGITTEDLHSSIVYRGQPGDIFLSQDMKGPGCEGDEHAQWLIRLHSGMRFSLYLVLSVTHGFRLFLTLFRRRKAFVRNEAETLGLLAPALIIGANALLAARLSGSSDLLMSASKEKGNFHYLLLDQDLKVVGLPEPTRHFLDEHFHGPLMRALPATLRTWLDGIRLMDRGGHKKWVQSTIFVSDSGRVNCKAYTLEDSSGKVMVLIAIHLLKDTNDFKSLINIGLTPREIQILGSLYTGETNKMIGEHLDIKHCTVRKHLLNIGRKLDALSRTEILAKAIEARDGLPSRQRLSTPPQGQSLSNRIPTHSSHPDNLSEVVIVLHRRLAALEDFDEVPELLKGVLSRHMNFDWAAVYCLSAANDIEKIAVNPGLRCDWVKLFTAIRKSISWLPTVRQGELGQIFLSQDLLDPDNEHDLHMKTIVAESTGAHYAMQMCVVKTKEHTVNLGLYRNDPERPYTKEDVAFMEEISPIIIFWAQSLVRLRENTIHQLSSSTLLEKEQVRAVLFDRHLCDVMWTRDALKMLKSNLGSSWRDIILPTLREWIRQTGLQQNGRKSASGPCPEHLVLDSFNLECCAYPLEGHILINFKRHESDPFLILKKSGLTKREIEVISYLPLGYTNRQIATVLGISEVTVKKHIERIGPKLNAVGRTSIMCKAEVLRRSLKN
jgi:DNA-binding NarL/FixJ family response regulator